MNKLVECNCRVCQSLSKPFFQAKILNKYEITYFLCPTCGFLFTEQPYWLTESYAESMNLSDTGTICRSEYHSKIITNLIGMFFDKKKHFLDYAGGYGTLTRIMRDIGYSFYSYDKYTPNVIAKGFDYHEKLDIDMISCIEVFEHLVNPCDEIEKLLAISENLFITTELFDTSKTNTWDYLGLDHGQHISFYSLKTFQYLAHKYNLHYTTNKHGIHLLTKEKLNYSKFRFAMSRRTKGLANWYIRKTVESKTMEDMQMLKLK